MYERILLPTDGSEGTVEATHHALTLADRFDATLYALSVVDRRKYLDLPEDRRGPARKTFEKRAERATAEAALRADETGVGCETAVREGLPYSEILAHADEVDADLLVVGAHGETDHERHVRLGSVARRLTETADVPVVVVNVE